MPIRSSLSVVVLSALLASCTGGAAPGDKGGATAAADTGPRDMLIVATGSDINNLLPVVAASASDGYVIDNIYMKGLNSDFDCELTYKPSLYQSWDWSEDSLSLTMTLNESFTWADGKPVTAEDVAFAYELVADKDVASPRLGYTDKFAAPPEVLAPNKIKFSWTEPGDRITRLAEASAYHVPKHLLTDAERSGLRTHALTTAPVVDGPFVMTKREPNAYFTLEPNPKFTGPDEMKAKLKIVRFEIIPEYQTRLLKLKKGEIDLADGIAVKDADELRKNNPELKIVSRGYRFMDYIAWNLNDPRFKDVRVRRAMAHAVSIDSMIKRLLTGEDGTKYAQQAYGTLTPEICSTRAKVDLIKQDVDKAKALLAEAGWTDTNGNDIV
ncbi:MAG: ABC transporter substrate-binding protein, partial [Myxococcota bacterium]